MVVEEWRGHADHDHECVARQRSRAPAMPIVLETEAGDEYVRRCAAFIRTHEQRLADAGFGRRPQRPNQPAALPNVLSWVGLGPSTAAPAPGMVLSTDLHHVLYLLIRCEALELPVGPLDVKLTNPTRPLSFASQLANGDRADAVSIRSSSAMSTMSRLSLGAGWWGRAAPPPVDTELKYIYSAFTKLPALSIKQTGLKLVAELAQDPLTDSVIPFDIFKNLQSLELLDVDPRAVLGWDRLSDGLRTLTIKRSGLEDVSDILIDAVVDDPLRREGKAAPKRRRTHRPNSTSRNSSWHSSQLPPTVPEDPTPASDAGDSSSPSPPSPTLPAHKWSRLRHLSLADNALTFFPTAPLANLTRLTHLDLSSNLLVAVPPGLGALYNLVSLNLSDNMIDSVLGIYTTLGSISSLDLSRNRLESLCGLERLGALERVDIRLNHVEESAEVGRLVTLPNIANISVEGNPFTEIEDEYRARCFEYFLKEGKTITLDGTPPTFYDRRGIVVSAPEHPPIEPAPAPSPNVVAVASPRPPTTPKTDPTPTTTAATPSPAPVPILTAAAVSPKPVIHHHRDRAKKRKPTRIVELDDAVGAGESSGTSRAHSRTGSVDSAARSPKPNSAPQTTTTSAAPRKSADAPSASPAAAPRANRHQRHATHVLPSPIREDTEPLTTPTSRPTQHRRGTSGSSLAGSKSAKRRARASASVYEPAGGSGGAGAEPRVDDAEAFRRKMEALRAEVGDSWLKVLSQQQQGGVA